MWFAPAAGRTEMSRAGGGLHYFSVAVNAIWVLRAARGSAGTFQ
jgi:hypothetical protein